MKDALGNPITIEAYYGYSRISNGIVSIVIGRAVDIIDNKVILDNIIEQWGVYGKIKNTKKFTRKRRVFVNTVFPVNIDSLNLEISN